MELSDEQIAELNCLHLEGDESGSNFWIDEESEMCFARAVEAEVRKQDDALIRQLVELLESVDAAMPFPVASQVLKVARARLEGNA